MNGYTVSGLTAVTKGTDVGEYTNTVFDGTANVEKDGVDVTDKVVVKTRAGKLVITPKSINPEDGKTGIQVTKPDDTMYNGEEQKNKPTVEDTKTGATLVENVDYTLSYSEDVINVGTVTVTITGTGNYEGTVDTSYEITPRKVIMTSADGSKVYDGTEKTVTGYDVKSISNKHYTKDDFTFTGKACLLYTSPSPRDS